MTLRSTVQFAITVIILLGEVLLLGRILWQTGARPSAVLALTLTFATLLSLLVTLLLSQ